MSAELSLVFALSVEQGRGRGCGRGRVGGQPGQSLLPAVLPSSLRAHLRLRYGHIQQPVLTQVSHFYYTLKYRDILTRRKFKYYKMVIYFLCMMASDVVISRLLLVEKVKYKLFICLLDEATYCTVLNLKIH